MHHRNPSNISKIYLQESDISSEDEHDQQTIKVTMHSNKDNNDDKVIKNNEISNRKQSSNDLNLLKVVSRPLRQRRKEITPRPNYSLNLWSIMKNCIQRKSNQQQRPTL